MIFQKTRIIHGNKTKLKKCAIVTGAASGIGKSVAQALSKEGHSVVVADINEQNGLSLAKKIGGSFVKVDLAKRESCRYLVDAAIQEYDRIDILVNIAGFQHVSPLEEFPEDKWDQMLFVMLTAPFLLIKYAWPYMKRQSWGRVVNMGSIHSMIASPNKVAYIAAKHGLIGLTRAAAIEGGSCGINVNAICPAYVRTPLVENQIGAQARTLGINEDEVIEKVLLKSAAVKRMIEPEEISDLVTYLCSDKAVSITGACWTIDCGWTAQ